MIEIQRLAKISAVDRSLAEQFGVVLSQVSKDGFWQKIPLPAFGNSRQGVYFGYAQGGSD